MGGLEVGITLVPGVLGAVALEADRLGGEVSR